jgi:ABC-type nitrate/sulfonate/bicarbonate transport system ATPase subunit
MAISLKGIRKGFRSKDTGQSVTVLDGIDLDVPESKVVALFGPNGCGKTTVLNIVAGIEKPDGGDVRVTGKHAHGPAVGYAFQNFRDVLLPWESALDNVTFGLRAMGVSSTAARERAAAFLDKHGFAFPRGNYPYQLSVGQQQTVALTRTLIQEPANVLLDEPFSALDNRARFRMQDFVDSIVKTNTTAVLFVTHDVDEALYVSDEVVMLSKLPARVLKRLPVHFPRPRWHDLLTSAEFSNLRREVVATFLEEVGR